MVVIVLGDVTAKSTATTAIKQIVHVLSYMYMYAVILPRRFPKFAISFLLIQTQTPQQT